MNIGFDAKRAFHNGTGLGHYSRTLLNSLAEFFPEHEYFLFNPKASDRYKPSHASLHEVTPTGFINQVLPSLWRSKRVVNDLKRFQIDLYHGLSHEIPVGISNTKVKSVVTIHDLIHERFPDQYSAIDRKIYTKKFTYACKNANHIIAISEQTKKDIIEFYGIQPSKITVCYQSCNPAFGLRVSEEEKQAVRKRYHLPERFFLYVGSIVERKNLLGICEAMRNFQVADIPLVVIGDGGAYKKKVQAYIAQHNLSNRIIFLSDQNEAKSDPAFKSASVFPHIYQSALALIYPSFFEGFGIPVLEALFSQCSVITSNVSSLPEAGGPGAWYINPANPEEIAAAMKNIITEKELAQSLKEKGSKYAERFTTQSTATKVMEVYKSI